MKNKDANIISFKVFFNQKGLLMTELSKLPEDKVPELFKDIEEQDIINFVMKKVSAKLSTLHDELENELNALNTRMP